MHSQNYVRSTHILLVNSGYKYKLWNCKPHSILSFKMETRYYDEQKLLVSLSYTYKRLAGYAQFYVLAS